MTIYDIYRFIDSIMTFSTAMSYDNSGILIGSETDHVKKILICLDITTNSLDIAIENGVNLIVCHHPIIFDPLKSISSKSLVYRLIQHNIGVIATHTNLDMADGGLNDFLCKKFGLEDIENIESIDGKDNKSIARIGNLKIPIRPTILAEYVKKQLNSQSIGLVSHNDTKIIKRVAVCSGAGDFLAKQAFLYGADAFITSQIKHETAIWALEQGFVLIDAGHYETENYMFDVLGKRLIEHFTGLDVIDFQGKPTIQRL